MHRTTLILLAIVAIPFYSICQCSATGLTNANSFSNDPAIGSLSFQNYNYAKNNDGNCATATAAAVLISSANTNYLKATNFGFNLPVTAVICGVEVSVVKKATGLNLAASVTDNKISLVINGTVTGNNYATSTSWPSSNTTAVYGGSNDKWGINTSTLNYANINSANFGIVFSANVVGLAGIGTAANIDQVQANVYYDVALLGMELESFTAIKNNGSCFLSWAVNTDNNFKNFILQRSADLNNWENISDINARENQQQYLFDDENLPSGNNYYRLMMTNLNGAVTYSNISMIPGQSDESLRIYPNPASDNFTITTKRTVHNISLIDEYGRTIKSINIPVPTNLTKVPIADLKSGTYFVQIDNAVLKLWKK